MASRSIRIFLVYAEEDYKFRDLMISQARNSRLGVEFADMPTKQPWVERWKGAVRTRTFECDGSIIFVSRKLKQGPGIKWELECVSNAGFPLLGVYTEKCDRSAIPDELDDSPVIDWNWPEIAGFIESLGKPARTAAR
jgi:hypothetical protein